MGGPGAMTGLAGFWVCERDNPVENAIAIGSDAKQWEFELWSYRVAIEAIEACRKAGIKLKAEQNKPASI